MYCMKQSLMINPLVSVLLVWASLAVDVTASEYEILQLQHA